MFNRLFRRSSKTAAAPLNEQLMLDVLRFNHADDSFMQLHCDRMQTALDTKNRAK